MRNFLAMYKGLDLIQKIGVWGALASIIGLLAVFAPRGTSVVSPLIPDDTQKQHSKHDFPDKQGSDTLPGPQEIEVPIEGTSSPVEQIGQGDNSPIINNSGSGGVQVEINKSSHREATILDNRGSPVLVLNSFPQDNDFIRHALEPENQLGIAEVGTEIEVIEEKTTTVAMMNASKVQILNGKFKDSIGWISSNAVRRVRLPD